MSHVRCFLLLGAVLLFSPGNGICGEKLINVQGRLTDSSGNPLSGNRAVVFRLYNSTSDPTASRVWEDTLSVALSSGLFNVSLGQGAGSLDSVPFNRPYYLGIQVSGDASEMRPRQRLGAAAYALGSLGDFHVKGKIGVGTSTPTTVLEVSGDASPQVLVRSKTQSSHGLFLGHDGALDLYPGASTSAYKFSLAGSEKARITSDGKVGIGTTAPGAPLEIRSDTAPQLLVGHRSSSSYRLTVNHAGAFDMPGGNANYSFRIGGADRLFIGNNAKVGIGTTNPSAGLEVRDDGNPQFVVGHRSSPGYRVTINHAGTFDMPGGNANYNFKIAGTDRLFLGYGGNVGINTSAPDVALEVGPNGNGTVHAASYASHSSRALKTNIAYLGDDQRSSAIELLKGLRPVSFNYAVDIDTTTNRSRFPLRRGLIAEEAPPQVLDETKKGVSLNEQVMLLILANQRLIQRIEALERNSGPAVDR